MLTVNGTELQKHQLMGPVGYTVVGSPTITDGVASGLTRTDYIKLSSKIQGITDWQNFHIHNEFKVSSLPSTAVVFCIGAYNIKLSVRSGNYFYFQYRPLSSPTGLTTASSNASTIPLNSTIIVDLDCVKDTSAHLVIKSGTSVLWDFSTNDFTINGTSDLLFGTDISYFGGDNLAIDLNQTYIKVNGKLWFWQPRETERIVVNGVEVWTKPVPPTPLGPVIDENTIELYHFDDNLKETINNTTRTSTSNYFSYSDGKFDKAIYTGGKSFGWSTSGTHYNSSSQSFTFDFWIKAGQFSESYKPTICLGDSGDYYIQLWNNYLLVSNDMAGTSSDKQFTIDFTVNTWAHIAYVHDLLTNKDYVFFNGSLLGSWTRTNNYAYFAFTLVGRYIYLDEFRGSDIARWTADFTPPTEPYGGN